MLSSTLTLNWLMLAELLVPDYAEEIYLGLQTASAFTRIHTLAITVHSLLI